MNRVGNIVARDGVFAGLLVLTVGVPLIASPYTQTNVFLIKTVFLQSIVFAVFILWLARKFLNQESFTSIPLAVPWLSLMGVGLLSFAYSAYRYAVFEEFLRFLSFFLLYVLIVQEVTTERRRILIVDVITFATIIVCLYGILQALGFHLFAWERKEIGRVMSLFGNPNFLGTYLVAVIPLPLALSMRPGLRRKVLAGIASASALICLVLAGTRSAWIGFAVSLVLLVLLVRKVSTNRFGLRAKVPLLVLLLLILLLVVLNQDAILNRISELRDPQGSAFFRMRIWEATSQMIRASPVFGNGLGTFQIVFPSFRYPGFAAQVPIGNLLHAHSEYLEIWAEMGLLGLGVFLWLMVSFFRYALKRLKSEKEQGLIAVGLLCGVAGVLVDSLFSASMRWTGPAFAFWLILSLAVAMIRPEETATKREHGKRRGRLIQIVVISAGIMAAALVARWHLQKYRANVHLGKAQALLDGGLPSQACQELEEAQDLNPQCLAAIYLVGCLEIKEGDFQGAKRSFDKLEKLAPDYANSHEWKGYLHFRLGDLSLAEEEFRSCIRQKGSVFRYNMLGRIYSLQGKWDQALEQLQYSLRLGTETPKPRTQGAAAFSPEQRSEPPVELATDAETEPASDFEEAELVKAHMMLARIYYQKEEYEKSIEQVQSIDQESLNEEQRGTIAGLLDNIAWSYAKRGENLDRALGLCEKALRLSHPHPELVHDTKAWVYLKKGSLKEAKLEIARALEIAPADTLLRRHLELIEQAAEGKLKNTDPEEKR